MSKKTGKKPQKTSADKLLLDFMKDNKITLVVDVIDVVNTDIKDLVYVQIRRPRVRVFYLDDIKDLEKKSEIEIAN